ncbi:hypothetical protein CYMTET_37903 [Cymbomonas tetramitiformis]|uniref:Uncharacterized protein n=1 Tax=Cymbomonas tetramitiformis TaxID=36881 RepID=A0AAE0CD52_9CHLO|nr:hypothetical protein CYMTET_37903 [Cymbomonas tetramitiformis]
MSRLRLSTTGKAADSLHHTPHSVVSQAAPPEAKALRPSTGKAADSLRHTPHSVVSQAAPPEAKALRPTTHLQGAESPVRREATVPKR